MNEYNIKVNFVKGQILTNLKKLVQNDYNTTKLNFTFDKEGRVLFKMLYPDGTQYVDEIQNNELIFGKGVLIQEGTYEYEISLYSEDGRLTDYAVKSFEVRSELVDTDEIVEPDDRVPVLDTLINEVNTIKKDVEDGKYNGKDGLDGIDGKDGATPSIGDNGNWYIDGIDTGMPSQGKEGPQGPAGGLSLEEVKVITGELENLGTEDKSNLVNAINEAMTSGSGIYFLANKTCPSNGSSMSLTDKEKEMMNEIVNKVFENQSKENVLLVVNFTSGYPGNYVFAVDNYRTFTNGTKCVEFKPLGQPVTGHMLTSNESCIKYISYSDDGSCYVYHENVSYALKTKVLQKNNTTSYTPTGDYHPATKKYVDDAIINAITTTLEGEY